MDNEHDAVTEPLPEDNNEKVPLDTDDSCNNDVNDRVKPSETETEHSCNNISSSVTDVLNDDSKQHQENACEMMQFNDEENIENEVYNMHDDSSNVSNLEANDGESNERVPKRPVGVIVIDDSDSDDSSICHVESYQATASEAKKLRKGYSSSEKSSSYSDESDVDDDSPDIIYSMPSKLSKYEVTPKKTTSHADIMVNEYFKSEETIENFATQWSSKEPFTCENITLHNDPFQICILDNFLNDTNVINSIVEDMNTLDWFRKTMDLYEFYRTTDLCELSWQRNIKAVYEVLKNDTMKWVAKVTNSNLTHMSASCALYGPGDHLLPHDDLLEDRKIAFILYLAPWNIPRENEQSDDQSDEVSSADDSKTEHENRIEKGWLKSMGGALEFFSTDEEGRPSTVTKTLLPCNNTFAFFKVHRKSFHQVSEVLSFDFPRLTINGWFHGPSEDSEEESKAQALEKSSAVNSVLSAPNSEVFQNDLSQWISPTYLSPKCKNQIFEKFEETSEISLETYFLEAKYEAILELLQNTDIQWESCGAIHLRNYYILPLDKIREDAASPLKEVIDVLTSKHFFTLLKDYTGVPVLSYCKLEIQKWTAGCYTVIPVKDDYATHEIDVAFYLGSPERQLKGGIITYLTPEDAESDPIISIGQKNNALNIVHSEAGVAKFNKYISKLSLKQHENYYTIVCSYRSTPPEE